MTLADFLKEEAVKQRSEVAAFAAKRKEWVEAVERLVERLRGWLQESDDEHVLDVQVQPREIHEEGVGRYTVPDLVVRLRDREVRVQPLARHVVGRVSENDGPPVAAQGRVDLTATAEGYMLYRIVDERGERWVLLDGTSLRGRPLDRAAFDEAMLNLLR